MQNFIKIPLILAFVTLISSGLLMLSEHLTHDKIALQKKMRLLDSLKSLIPNALHDNDITLNKQTIFQPKLLGHRKEQPLYIGTKNGKLSVLAIPVTARNGYAGDIDLMIGITINGEITSVKIIEQHETPGLGDLIVSNKSNWLTQFPKKSLLNPTSERWKVKKDGGDFDQLTGATITPRAVVAAIKNALLYAEKYTKENNL